MTNNHKLDYKFTNIYSKKITDSKCRYLVGQKIRRV